MESFFNQDDLVNEWDKFIKIIKKNPIIRPVTMEAWKRCEDAGLKPDELKFKFLSDKELEQKIAANLQLIEVARPYLEHLSLSLIGIKHLVTLTDNHGWVIDINGTAEELGGKQFGLCLGASWSEKDVGNNGVGTSLAIGQPVLIYGMEHFRKAYSPLTCVDVPIRANGKIIGGIDVCVPNEYAHPARLNLTIACAHSIESTISSSTSQPFGISSDMKLSAASELIATAVHDLKNPLAVIRGLGQLGKLTTDKEKASSYFDRVIKQADELNNLVMELLDVFRPQEIIPMTLSPIIEEVIQEFEPEFDSKGITLIFDDYCDAYVNISESLFKRTIRNLITNAVQAIEDRGLIEIKIQLQEDFIVISIRDTAGGIPEEMRENLFEPFTFRRSGGTGLGLFMVYHSITNTHKGQVWFNTEGGEGTTFFIKLPVSNGIENIPIRKYQLV
jgi:transcriptional regulator of acetoin/glycerol metabolism